MNEKEVAHARDGLMVAIAEHLYGEHPTPAMEKAIAELANAQAVIPCPSCGKRGVEWSEEFNLWACQYCGIHWRKDAWEADGGVMGCLSD